MLPRGAIYDTRRAMKYECGRCGESKDRIRDGKYPNGCWKWIDINGRHWSNRFCPKCKNAIGVEGNHRRGRSKPIDKVTNKQWMIARRSERVTAVYLKSIGYKNVKLTTMMGPDITCEKDGDTFTFEVKTIMSRGKNSYRVGRVTPLRRNDDMVALVLPGEFIHIEPMSDFLKKYNSGSSRSNSTITALVLSIRPNLYRQKLEKVRCPHGATARCWTCKPIDARFIDPDPIINPPHGQRWHINTSRIKPVDT
jgi:hypothetical protein